METVREFAVQDADYVAFCRLRQDWLRTPLGLELHTDDLEADKTQRLFGIFDDGRFAGGAAIRLCGDGSAQLRQMIIAPDSQRRGFGRRLVGHIESTMGEAGIGRIFMHARLEAAEFYARCGYERVGDEFVQVTIPHVRMEKTLAADRGDLYVRPTSRPR